MAYVSFAFASGYPPQRSAVNDEIDNYISFLENNTSGTGWSKWEYGEVPFNTTGYADDNDGQIISSKMY